MSKPSSLGMVNQRASYLCDSQTPISLLYRGSLSSCNYDCDYCPFAKTYNTREQLKQDASELERFVDWVSDYADDVSVLFTPWGEGLVRKHYQQAMIRLSHLSHVQTVAIQTNLCINTQWLALANISRVALWATYHPSQVSLSQFVARCVQLDDMGVKLSVGMVAIKTDFEQIKGLRHALPTHIPMWLNAYDRRTADYYDASELAWLLDIDAHFLQSVSPAPSLSAPCKTGVSVFSVNRDGRVKRCHFVPDDERHHLGNLYDGSFMRYLTQVKAKKITTLPCPMACCDCFIGYVHRPDLAVHTAYGGGRLARVPSITKAQ